VAGCTQVGVFPFVPGDKEVVIVIEGGKGTKYPHKTNTWAGVTGGGRPITHTNTSWNEEKKTT